MNIYSHKQAAKRSIYYIREYFSRNIISKNFEFRAPCRLPNEGFFQQVLNATLKLSHARLLLGNKYDFYVYLTSHI